MTVQHAMNRWTMIAAALILVACAAPGAASPQETPMPTADSTPEETPAPERSQAPQESQPPEGSPADSGAVPAELIEFARTDAAQRASVDPQDVTVLTAEAVTWNDGSLGCPEPGMMYTQALVDGYRVVVEAGGTEYHYHGARTGGIAYCADPQPPLQTSQ